MEEIQGNPCRVQSLGTLPHGLLQHNGELFGWKNLGGLWCHAPKLVTEWIPKNQRVIISKKNSVIDSSNFNSIVQNIYPLRYLYVYVNLKYAL